MTDLTKANLFSIKFDDVESFTARTYFLYGEGLQVNVLLDEDSQKLKSAFDAEKITITTYKNGGDVLYDIELEVEDGRVAVSAGDWDAGDSIASVTIFYDVISQSVEFG